MVTRRRKKKADEQTESGSLSVELKRVVSQEIIDDKEQTVEFESEVFQTEPAEVEVHAGYTRNMGNFESLRVDVTVRLPCYKERVTQKSAEAGALVQDILENEVVEYEALERKRGAEPQTRAGSKRR